MVYWKWKKLSPDQLLSQILHLVPVCKIFVCNRNTQRSK